MLEKAWFDAEQIFSDLNSWNEKNNWKLDTRLFLFASQRKTIKLNSTAWEVEAPFSSARFCWPSRANEYRRPNSYAFRPLMTPMEIHTKNSFFPSRTPKLTWRLIFTQTTIRTFCYDESERNRRQIMNADVWRMGVHEWMERKVVYEIIFCTESCIAVRR